MNYINKTLILLSYNIKDVEEKYGYELTRGYEVYNFVYPSDDKYVLKTYVKKPSGSRIGCYKNEEFVKKIVKERDEYKQWLMAMKLINSGGHGCGEDKKINCSLCFPKRKTIIMELGTGISYNYVEDFILQKEFGSLDELFKFVNENKDFIGELNISEEEIINLKLGENFYDIISKVKEKKLKNYLICYPTVIFYYIQAYFFSTPEKIDLNKEEDTKILIEAASNPDRYKFGDIEIKIGLNKRKLEECEENKHRRGYEIVDLEKEVINEKLAKIFTVLSQEEDLFEWITKKEIEKLLKEIENLENKIDEKSIISIKNRYFNFLVKNTNEKLNYETTKKLISKVDMGVKNYIKEIKEKIENKTHKLERAKIIKKIEYFQNKTLDEIAEEYFRYYTKNKKREEKYLFLAEKILDIFDKGNKYFEKVILRYLTTKYYKEIEKSLQKKYKKFKETKLFLENNNVKEIHFYFPPTESRSKKEISLYTKEKNNKKYISAEQLLRVDYKIFENYFLRNKNYVGTNTTLKFDNGKKITSTYVFDFKEHKIYEK